MTVIPSATFLAGSLLSLLIPLALLIALVVWYLGFIRRVPEPVDGSEAAEPPAPAVGASPPAGAGGPPGGQP